MDGILRSFFGFPKRPEGPKSGSRFEDPFFDKDPFFTSPGHGPGPNHGETFFFWTPFSHGSFGFPQDPDDGYESNESNPHGFGSEDFFFGRDRGDDGFPQFPRMQDDMFRHFDEMFRSFDDVFRSMGVAEFPSHHRPSVPSIEPPPPGTGRDKPGSLRDHMLKQPDSHLPDSTPAQERPPATPPAPEIPPGQEKQAPSFFSRFWSPGFGNRDKDIIKKDSDLDEEIRKGDLDAIFGRREKSEVDIMSPVVDPYTTQKRVSVRSYRSIDGRSEENYRYQDGEGNEKTIHRRTMGDQTHEVTTNKDGRSGKQDIKENFTNMDENDKCEFDQRWKPPPMKAARKLKEGMEKDSLTRTIFKNLYVFNFPGFPQGRETEREDEDRGGGNV